MALIQFVLGCSTCTFVFCATMLWTRRDSGDRSRRILSIVWLLLSLMLIGRALIEGLGKGISPGILPPLNLFAGLLMLTLLYFYPVEVIRPGWLNVRRTFYMLLPALAVGVVFRLPGVEFRYLQSVGDMLAHIDESNVWGRLVLLFGIIFPFALLLHVVPYNWTKSRVCLSWIRHYTCVMLLITALYVAFMLTYNLYVSSAHLLVCLVFASVVTYDELFVRFSLADDYAAAEPDVKPVDFPPSTDKADNPLVVSMNSLLEDEEIWRNPDLTVADLARILHTNRSYLNRAIHDAGYANFADLINRRRVEAFCRMTDQDSIDSILEAFFLVGFRSKETALRCFKKYTGMLPCEYLRKKAGNNTQNHPDC